MIIVCRERTVNENSGFFKTIVTFDFSHRLDRTINETLRQGSASSSISAPGGT
jgi:hypothetical protein